MEYTGKKPSHKARKGAKENVEEIPKKSDRHHDAAKSKGRKKSNCYIPAGANGKDAFPKFSKGTQNAQDAKYREGYRQQSYISFFHHHHRRFCRLGAAIIPDRGPEIVFSLFHDVWIAIERKHHVLDGITSKTNRRFSSHAIGLIRPACSLTACGDKPLHRLSRFPVNQLCPEMEIPDITLWIPEFYQNIGHGLTPHGTPVDTALTRKPAPDIFKSHVPDVDRIPGLAVILLASTVYGDRNSLDIPGKGLPGWLARFPFLLSLRGDSKRNIFFFFPSIACKRYMNGGIPKGRMIISRNRK